MALQDAPTATAAVTPGGDAPPIIRTAGLTKTYAGTDFKAVDDLDLEVQPGEIFGLLGPNGAGRRRPPGCSPPG